MRVINGENLILGRLASIVAKAAMIGEEVAVVNSEKVMISGTRKVVMERQNMLSDLKGKPAKGRFYDTRPDYFVSRVIRGMLPMRMNRGREAMKKVKCYISVPEKLKTEKMETFDNIHINKLPNVKYISVREVCKLMSGKDYPLGK